MPRLTLFSKILIVIFVLIVSYFIFFPLISSFIFPSQNSYSFESTKKEIIVFIDSSALTVQIIDDLKQLSSDVDLADKFYYSIYNIAKNPDLVKKYNVSSTPYYIIGDKSFSSYLSPIELKAQITTYVNST